MHFQQCRDLRVHAVKKSIDPVDNRRWQLSVLVFPVKNSTVNWKVSGNVYRGGKNEPPNHFFLLNLLTVLIILLPEREIVVHVWRISIVEQVGRQLPLQTDRFMRQFPNLNEQFLIIWYRKRHCCTLCPSHSRPRVQILKEQPSDSNSANKNWISFVSTKCCNQTETCNAKLMLLQLFWYVKVCVIEILNLNYTLTKLYCHIFLNINT